MEGTKLTLIFLACFAAFIPTLNAQEHDDDDANYWKERALLAYNNTLSTYKPYPHLVTSHTNDQVHRSLSTGHIFFKSYTYICKAEVS